MKGKYFLSDYLLHKNIKLQQGYINLINAPAGSGKTTFVFKELINNTYKYLDYSAGHPDVDKKFMDGYTFDCDLDRIIYICDTKMLKDKTLDKYKNITTIFKDNFFKRVKNDITLLDRFQNNKITVMTYKQFGWCLGIKNIRDFISENIHLIVMDEFHNLFYYNNKFKSDKDHSYQNIINNLSSLAMNHLLVSLTATPYYANKEMESTEDYNTPYIYRIILNNDDLKEIRQYENKFLNQILNPVNDIKWLCLHKDDVNKIKNGNKVLIYSEKIITCNKYKNMLINSGYKVETLFTEKKLNDEQKKLRQYLIKNEKYPDDLDILIINKAYEGGWDIKDNRVQFVIIDSYNPTVITQVRNRCRFDIEKLVYAMKEVRIMHDPYITDDGYYRMYIEMNKDGKTYHSYISNNYTIKFTLEDKYIGYKLPKDKSELIEKYGSYDERKQCNWTTFKKDLIRNGYYTKQVNKGTYIFKEGCPEIIKDSKKEIKKMKELDIFINYIENQWDKKRIACNDIMDILDLGRKSWNKLINDEETLNYLKNNRIKIGVIKGGNTKYMFKY